MMKSKTWLVALAITGGLAAVGGCGGSAEPEEDTASANTVADTVAELEDSREESQSLKGLKWQRGKLLEQVQGPHGITRYVAAMDAAGNLYIVYISQGDTLDLVKGTPRHAGLAPQWSKPKAIYHSQGRSGITFNYQMVMAVSSNGNIFISWVERDGALRSFMRYTVANDKWTEPATIKYLGAQVHINKKGDVAFADSGGRSLYYCTGTNTCALQKTDFHNVPVNSAIGVGLDERGNITVGGAETNSSTGETNYVVHRGNVKRGVGEGVILDSRLAPVTGGLVGVAPTGEALVSWTQNDGSANVAYVATSRRANGAWRIHKFPLSDWPFNGDGSNVWVPLSATVLYPSAGRLKVFEEGDAACFSKDWIARTDKWGETVQPNGCASDPIRAISSNGSVLSIGWWLNYRVYDASNGVTSPTPDGYVFGTSVSASASYSAYLSPKGVGALVMTGPWAVLPTPAQPNGDSTGTQDNLWAIFLKK